MPGGRGNNFSIVSPLNTMKQFLQPVDGTHAANSTERDSVQPAVEFIDWGLDESATGGDEEFKVEFLVIHRTENGAIIRLGKQYLPMFIQQRLDLALRKSLVQQGFLKRWWRNISPKSLKSGFFKPGMKIV